MTRFQARSQGFTLVELLVVIAIIGILVGLLLPAVQAAREAARRMQCTNHLKQMALAMHNYHDVHNSFPIGCMWAKYDNVNDTVGNRGTGWAWTAMTLPYLEQNPLADRIDWTRPPANAADTSDKQLQNKEVVETPLALARCPSDQTPASLPMNAGGMRVNWACSNYSACGGAFNNSHYGLNRADGLMHRHRNASRRNFRGTTSLKDINDGSSNQIMLTETAWRLSSTTASSGNGRKRWYGSMHGRRPEASSSNRQLCEGHWRMNPPISASVAHRRRAASSQHPGGAVFALADGSIRFISETIHHTQRPWRNNDSYDKANVGAAYGVYQRLWSKSDGLPLGDGF